MELSRQCFENSNQASFVFDRDGKILLWNKAASALFHYTEEEALGKLIQSLIAPMEDRARYTVGGKEDYRGFQQSVSKRTLNLTFKNKEGSEIPADFYSVLDESRSCVYAYIVQHSSKDIALNTILEHSPYMFFAKDLSGRYIEVSNTFERYIQKRRQDILGKTDYDLMKEEYADIFAEREREVLQTKEIKTYEDSYNRDGNGSTLWISTTRFAVYDEMGEVKGIWAIAHDTTALRQSSDKINELERERLIQNEQLALQASKLKSEFLANMSHEIRTPINGILGLNNLLRDTELTQEQREYVEGIHRSCGSLMSVINDILDLSKAEAGRVELEVSDMDVRSLMRDMETFFGPLAAEKKLYFAIDDRLQDADVVIKADYARLRQILTNLISNAVKFTFTGGVTLRCERKQSEQQDVLHFDIIDTGIGIEAKQIEKLFKPFSQADASTTRRFGGTGLGLSISKNFVTLMDGKIGVESEVDKGSIFWIEIPFVLGDSEKLAASHTMVTTGTDGSTKQQKTLTILVAEDNLMNQKVLVKTLEKLGHRPTAADNGLEALQLLQMNPYRFDMIFMDCAMPIMDGYEATKAIRALPHPIRDIPIIAMTANALSSEREHVLQVGMNDYMSKPFRKDDLIKMIARWSGGGN